MLQGRLFKAEPSKSWTPLGTGDAELSIVQKKGEAFLTFFLTVGSSGVEVRRSTASSSDARFQPLALYLLCFLLSWHSWYLSVGVVRLRGVIVDYY